jgi:hypothetical protein
MSSVEQPQTLEELTTTAFCEQPIRNAVLIDEQFPKLSDALESLDSSEEDTSLATKFSEWETAKELYEAFHKLKISCDVENDPSGLGELSAKIKKSDLVVLDLHLRDSTDATDSIDVIKSLASDTKFNLVVVYTKDDQLRRIAFQLAGSVRGCDEIENSDSEVSLASIKDDLGKYDLPVEQMAIDHIRGRKLSGEEVGKLRGDLAKEHKIVHGEQELVLSALTSHLLRDQYGALAEKPISIASEMNFDRPTPWMVFPNMFVVVAHKGTTRPNELLTVLKDAILDWKPGIVRTIISQIQNTMADSGYAFAGSLTGLIKVRWFWGIG